jgi:hypothetical protein
LQHLQSIDYTDFRTPYHILDLGREGARMVASSAMRTVVWTNCMPESYPDLAKVSIRLLSMHATSCSSERN